jgi:hypothetical protein
MIVQLAEYLAWIISAALAAWMLYDAIKVSRDHSEEFLTTSVEGTDELVASPVAEQVLDPTEERA